MQNLSKFIYTYLSKFTFQKKLKHRDVELLAKADDYLEITQIIHATRGCINSLTRPFPFFIVSNCSFSK